MKSIRNKREKESQLSIFCLNFNCFLANQRKPIKILHFELKLHKTECARDFQLSNSFDLEYCKENGYEGNIKLTFSNGFGISLF